MAKKPQATWGGRFREKPDGLMVRFGESVSFDRRLAPYDARCSRAHAAALCRAGLLTGKERDAICKGLERILRAIEKGEFTWDENLEDVHMNIEHVLTARVPAAAKLHAGRSRNDQVAAGMRLYFKDAAAQAREALRELMLACVEKADGCRKVILPGYTHMRRAQPVTAAHHLLAYVEMLERDRARFQAVWEEANVCPLGSGALAGTTLPLDRDFIARELGFVDSRGRPRLTQNSLDAVASRDEHVSFTAACALCGSHLSRMAEDLILWSGDEFGFVELPESFTTGSSLMPQKRNPDALELIRGKAARLQGDLQTLLTLVKGLPMAYNRDLQEDKPPVFGAHDQVLLCLRVMREIAAGLRFNAETCLRAASDPGLMAADLVDYLVRAGVPFRQAHHKVGSLVALAEKTGMPLDCLPLEQVRKADERFGEDWREVFDLTRALKSREKTGMPGLEHTARQIRRWRKKLGAAAKRTAKRKRKNT